MALPFMPSSIREVGDASSNLPRNAAPRNLKSGSNHQEQVHVLDYFPNIEKSIIDSEGLIPVLDSESFHASADAARDETREGSISMHQNSLLAVKAEEQKQLPREDASSATASGAIEPAVGELSKDQSAIDMSTDSQVLHSGMENTRPIRPRNQTRPLLRSGLPLTTLGDPDEFQDKQKSSLPEEMSPAEYMKIDTTQKKENTVYKLYTKPTKVELSDSGLEGDSSDRPSYIPRGDRLAAAMLHLETKAAPIQDLELHDDVAIVASSDRFADAFNEAVAGFLQEPDKNCSEQDSCIAPIWHDVAIAASRDDFAQRETTETAFLQGSMRTTRKQDFSVVISRNDLPAAAYTDEKVTQDEKSSQLQDVPDSYLTTDTKPNHLELVRPLGTWEYHSSPYHEIIEIDELEYVTPPNESFKRSRDELQDEEEFHTPRAIFPDDLVFACNVEMSSTIVPVLSDNLLLASPYPVHDEEMTSEAGIQEFPHSDESTHGEGSTSETEFDEFPNNRESIHGEYLKLKTVIQELPHNNESRHDIRLTPKSVDEEVSHNKESIHDKGTSNESVIQECQHFDESTHGKGLTSGCVVEEFPLSRESTYDIETSNESQVQEVSESDESTQGEGFTSESAVEEFPHGKASAHDKELSDETVTQEFPHNDESRHGEELKCESVIQEFPQSEWSTHNKGLTSESIIQEFSQSKESAHDENSMAEEFGEFQSSGELVIGEALKSGSAVQEFLQSKESTLSNEVTPISVCGEEIRLDSVQVQEPVNESASRNQLTPDLAVENEMQPRSSLKEEIARGRELPSELIFDEEMLYESMLGEVMMHAPLTGEEMNTESECDGEMPQDLVIHGKRSQIAVLQQEATYESVLVEETNSKSESTEIKTPDSVCLTEVKLKSLPGEELIHESKLGEEISSEAEQTEIKMTDLVYSKHESKLHEEIHPESENPETDISYLVYSKDITPESLLSEEICQESENSKIKISESVYSKDISSGPLHYNVKAAEELQGEARQSPTSALESLSPDEKVMFVQPVKEPLFYGRNITPSFRQASESEIPGVASKPTMSEEKTAQMLEWDEMNLDMIPREECNSNENFEQEALFAMKEGHGLSDSSLTISESDTEAGQFSQGGTVDHLDGFSNFLSGQSLGRQARTRLKWYSFSVSCNDVLQEEDEEDESSSSRSRSTFEGETIPNCARDSQTIQEDDVWGYSEITVNEVNDKDQSQTEQLEFTSGSQEGELTGNSLITENVDAVASGFGVTKNQMSLLENSGESQVEATQELTEPNESSNEKITKNKQDESVALQLTKNVLSASDSFGKNMSFERNVSESDTDTYPSCSNRPVMTLEDGGQSLSQSFELVKGSPSDARVLSETSKSSAMEMVAKISGKDLCSKVSEKELSSSDSSRLTETVTEDTGLMDTNMIVKIKEMEDEVSSTVKEDQALDELRGTEFTWDIDTSDEIQVDEIMASGIHKAGETEDEAERTRVLEDIKDATVITELNDMFTTDKTELIEDFNNKADVIGMTSKKRLKAGSFGRMCTVDEAEEIKSVDKSDIDDALCLVETETFGDEMANTLRESDTDILEAAESNNNDKEETESNEEDVLRIDTAVACFLVEAEETRVTDAAADEKEMIQVPAGEFQITEMPDIHRSEEADKAEDSNARTLDSAQSGESELQSILIEPRSYVSLAKSQEESRSVIQPKEATSSVASSSNLSHDSPNRNMFANQEDHLHATEYFAVHSHLIVKDSEEIDTIQEFKKGVDFPVTEVTHLDSNTNQGMPADRDYDETSRSENASVFFSATLNQNTFDSEYQSLDNKTKEESAQEGKDEEITAVHPNVMQDVREAKDEHEHIIPQEAPIFFAAASVQSHVDKDKPTPIDEDAGFSYVEPARDQQESELKFLHAHPQLVAKDSEEMDVIREIKDSGEYFLAHPGTRSQWEIPIEEEVIVSQKADIYSVSPVLGYHDKNDSDSSDKVHFDEQNKQGLNTIEKPSCKDVSATNDQPLDAQENWSTDVSGCPWDASNVGDEKKLSDYKLPSDESSTSKSTGRNEPLEHEETSAWPPLPEFLTTLEENATSTNCPTLYQSDVVWPLVDDALKSIKSPKSAGSDIAAEVSNSDKPCRAGEAGTTVADDNDGISHLHGMTDGFVSERLSEASERFGTKNSEGLQALESEDWPPIPDFFVFHDEFDDMKSRNAIIHEEGESQCPPRATHGTTEELNVRDLTIIPENQLMDSSEHWPPLPDFILEELVSESPKLSLNTEPGNFHSASQAELLPSSPKTLDVNEPEESAPIVQQTGILLRTGQKEFDPFTEENIHGAETDYFATDVTKMMSSAWLTSHTHEDEALPQFLNEDSFDDQTDVVPPDLTNEQLELTVVSRLVSEIVSSAKQSVEVLAEELASTNVDCMATCESTPNAEGIQPELKESAMDFQNESPLLQNVLLGDHPANCDISATNLLDCDYEEASIYWTQPVMVKPPVADDVSLQSSPDENALETVARNTLNTTGPQNNEPGYEVRQFCAVASSAFTDLTKVTGSQGDMKSHHNIQSHIELGITACQSWSDLDVLPCGSSKSLQLIGAPELSSWKAGNDEVKRKCKEEEPIGSLQVAKADSQSMHNEGDAIRKVVETEDIESGCRVHAVREPLLGCHADSMDTENNKESHGSSVHIWMPIEEEGPFEETASNVVMPICSGVMSSPTELLDEVSGQQSNIIDEATPPVEGAVDLARLASTESKGFTERVPILVEKDCPTVSKSPDADVWGRESNEVELEGMPGEHEFSTVQSSTSLSTEVAADSMYWSEIDQFSAGVSGELCAPEMSCVQELLHSGHLEPQQGSVVPNSARISGRVTDVQQLLSADREPQQEVDVLNPISCSLCKTDWAALSGNPDAAATPLSDQGAWVQTGHTWIFEEETLRSPVLSCKKDELLGSEEETECVSSFSTKAKAADEILVDDDWAYSPTFVKVETFDEEIKPSVSTEMDAGITQLASSANDKKESASATSLTEEPSQCVYSPQVVEIVDSTMGLVKSGAELDQENLMRGEIDADFLGLQGGHLLQNESIPGKDVEDDTLSDSCKPVLEHHCSLGTTSEQLNIDKPDGSPTLRPGDSVNLAQELGHCLTEINFDLVGEKAATDVGESDLLSVQTMPFPIQSEDELNSLSERFTQLCLESSSCQLETEALNNSDPLASPPKKGEDDGQQKYHPVSLVEEDQSLASSSDFPSSSSPELSQIARCPQDVESKKENAEWDSRMQDSSAVRVVGGYRVASEDSQTVNTAAEEERDIPRQYEDLEKAHIKDLGKDHDCDLNEDNAKDLDAKNEKELDNHERGLEKNLVKDQNKDHSEDQHKSCTNDLDRHYDEDQDKNHDKNQDKGRREDQEKDHVRDPDTHEEDQDKSHTKDRDTSHDNNQDNGQDEENVADLDANHDKVCKKDHEDGSDKDHDHHTGSLQIANKTDSFKDFGKELDLVEGSLTEEHGEYVQSIPLHSTESETDLIFSLRETQVEDRLNSGLEPPYKGTTSPSLTDDKDVTIIPVDVLDQSPQSHGPSVSPAFFIASEHGRFKIANPEERYAIRSSTTEFETDHQRVTVEQNEMKQGLDDDAQKTYLRTTASKADDGTSKTYEATVSNKVDGTSVSATDDDMVVPEIDDGTCASKTDEGLFTSQVDGIDAPKSDDETGSSEADEAIVASKIADDASNADDGRKVLENADVTTEPSDGVIASEIYVETADDISVTSEQ